jgi:cytoskeletal protein CcmA (bactofilin family)
MSPVKAVLKNEPQTESANKDLSSPPPAAGGQPSLRLAAKSSEAPATKSGAASPSRQNGFQFHARVPVIAGEATFRGTMPADGVISGNLNTSGGALSVRQRPRNALQISAPELDGEIGFKDMLRINGHIAGRVSSEKGTLIVDAAAIVDGDIEVGVAVIGGKVNGDVFGSERVELGPGAIINGNISTRSLAIKPGAVFTGDCRMLKD